MTPEETKFLKGLDMDGTISAEIVLEAAEPIDSPIHDRFTWDDTVAGHRYRLEEARALIRSIRVEVVRTERTVRIPLPPVYVRDPGLPAKVGGYAKLNLLKTREEMANEALDQELSRVASAIKRTRLIAQGLGLTEICEQKLTELVRGRPKRASRRKAG